MARIERRGLARRLTTPVGDASDRERREVDEAEEELERWRERVLPDAAIPLDTGDVARLVRDCFDALGVGPEAGESFSVNTVHFYRRRDILDAPEGRTSAARYALRHVWQAAGARLAGHLNLLSLTEARARMRGASEPALRRFVAARVADARGRQAARREVAPLDAAPRALASAGARPLPGAVAATVVELGGDAFCIIPRGHPAQRSAAGARALVSSLAAHFGLSLDS